MGNKGIFQIIPSGSLDEKHDLLYTDLDSVKCLLRAIILPMYRGLDMEDEVLSSYYFTVEIDGIQIDRFFSCGGLEMSTTTYEIEEGGFNVSTHKRTGHNRSPNLIFKKGINKNNELIYWFQRNTHGIVERKNISVILMNSAMEEIRRWDIYRAFPVRWKCSPLDANDHTFLVETIEIAHD